ncbi:ABC transporter ATP-binding protein [Desulfomonile tiedjei]|uniref:Amino acid/amide ABC transporter ATP-binding protein 1, HAAT family n=1 Tax=Desulfomonile tiedjei (strain ATCC 49306 / DSM 6799 / DCB-1) TaxID=706587 RepID=I4C562_DESTA|nr:ABC transporter ATP-binding protein [Desulfomonile tiedjei]AFM24703.1 amino acid/amide ABC transporter ATP-binding protein 1, HAAT family [Desulfomonile tiedjei DSM 6799]
MEPVLVLDQLDKSFGGLTVTYNVSFSVMPGEISAIIGPNGAGKTTLFNQITGNLLPDKGRILFKNEQITGLRPQEIVARGMGRSFQITSIFPEESVLENVRISCLSRRKEVLNPFRNVARFKEATDQAYFILESLGLAKHAERPAFELAHGDQKLLDIGIALGLEPQLLLLDEPTAGMSPDERQLTRDLIKRLWEEFNLTLIFIEHDMDIVFGIAQIVRVLQLGRLLAEGPPEEIRNNPEVITAYLGEEVR